MKTASKGKDLKPHIGIFGRRNSGKSSLINLLTGQDIAIVSDHPGTTTDPVKKSVEIFGIGPVVMVDTAGIDDEGSLGKLRVEKTIKTVPAIDLGILLLTDNAFGDFEEVLIRQFRYYEIPFIMVYNKSDLNPPASAFREEIKRVTGSDLAVFSVEKPDNKEQLIDAIRQALPETAYNKNSLFKGIVKPKDVVLLVTPIDSEAPEGRMILPQVMAWRDLLDNDCICMSVKESELDDFFRLGIKPALVVTDSQAFAFVSSRVPADVMLTGFSIVFSRFRGDFEAFLRGTPAIESLRDGDRVLILESCTHQVSCDDIGRVKIPGWLRKHTGKKLEFDVVAGLDTVEKNADSYRLVVQCGGCMVTRKQLVSRLKPLILAGIPVTNYGMTIAWVTGIFERVTQPFLNAGRDDI